MSGAFVSPLDDHDGLLPGRLAKVRVAREMAARLSRESGVLRVLDVGGVGVTPFNQHFSKREDALGRDPAFAAAHPEYFAGIYVKVVRAPGVPRA